MTDHNDSGGNGRTDEDKGPDKKQLRAALKKAGWVETTAFVEPGTPGAPGGNGGDE